MRIEFADNYYHDWGEVKKKDIPFVEKETKGLNRWSTNDETFQQKYVCSQFWEMPQLDYDGKLLGCCGNFIKPFSSNAFEQGLMQALNAPDFLYAKKMLLGQVPGKKDIPCTECWAFTQMQKKKNFFEKRAECA
jgi:hypothetical protein